MMRHRPDRTGFTLVEVLITLLVLATVSSLAVASFISMLDNYRLEGAVQGLHADLQFARSEAVKRNQHVRITFTSGNSWSYTLAALDNAGTPTTIKTATVADYPGTSMAAVSFGGGTALLLQPERGNMTDTGHVALTDRVVLNSAQGKQACVHFNLTGHSALCSPAGTGHLNALPTCAC